jgi:hypothetical protein
MMTMLRISLPGLLALGLAAMLAGCATTQMNAEWRDPVFSPGAAKRARVLVVCRAPDEALRRVCEDRWSNLLGAHGMVPERSYSIAGFPSASADTSAEMTAAVRASGVAALASMSLIPSDMGMVTSGPQVGVGVSGGSGGGHRGGGFGVGGIGISFPIGGATVTRSLGASSSFVDVASGKLVWSGTASTPASSDRLAQVGELVRVTIEAIRRAGLI